MTRNIVSFLFSPITALIITLLCLFFWISLYQTVIEITNSTTDIQVLRKNLTTMRTKLNNLETQIEVTKSNFIREKSVRDELLMQKEGEIIVKIENFPELETKKSQAEKQASPWEEWRKLIF